MLRLRLEAKPKPQGGGVLQPALSVCLEESRCGESPVQYESWLALKIEAPPPRSTAQTRGALWLRTNGVNTNEAAAKVMNFDRLGKRYALALLGR